MSAQVETTDHDVSIEKAAEMSGSEDVQLVDVRQDFEWEAGHIEGATHIPLDQLPARADEVNRDGKVVFVCRSGGRSAMATKAFRESGFEGVNMVGGMEAWVEAGKPIIPEDGEVAGPRPDNT